LTISSRSSSRRIRLSTTFRLKQNMNIICQYLNSQVE
jgi:hypothetical protein